MIYDTLKQLAELASPAYARHLARGRIKGDDIALYVYGKFATPDTILELLKDLAAVQADLEHARNTNKLEREENDKLLAELAELRRVGK